MIKKLTGWHVLAITLAAFGVIIGVNVTMAVMAVRTFPGLEVPNSYVASQNFDREKAAQQALGWTVVPDYENGELTLKISDRDGHIPQISELKATVGRPTHVRDDVSPDMRFDGGLWRGPVKLAPGQWILHVEATAADGTHFRQRLNHYHGDMVK